MYILTERCFFLSDKGVNLILDCVGGSYWDKNLRCIAVEGTWIVYGLMGGAVAEETFLKHMMRKRLTLVGTNLRPRSTEVCRDRLYLGENYF